MKLIYNNLKETFPDFVPICYEIEIESNALDKSKDVQNLIKNTCDNIYNKYNGCPLSSISKLEETRNAYKVLKKDPSHTKPACVSLVKRILSKKDLYIIGDAVDIGNVLSIMTNRSVCVADMDKISGDIYITVGKKEDSFEGINRSIINAENLIVYKDDLGVFGSTTSDTNRTKICDDSKRLFVMIMCFSHIDLEKDEKLLVDLFTKYTKIKKINKLEVNI